MAHKTAITALQEYCAKNKKDRPKFDCFYAEDGTSFVCQVQVLGITINGHGRSKRDAKQAAAVKVIKDLRLPWHSAHDNLPNIALQGMPMATMVQDQMKVQDEMKVQENRECQEKMDIPDEIVKEKPAEDMIASLRRYCHQNRLAQPSFDIVRESGTADAREFKAVCRIRHIKHYGVAGEENDAFQKAADCMLLSIVGDPKLRNQIQAASSKSNDDSVKSEFTDIFRTFHELTATNVVNVPGVLLCDRHNYFQNFDENLKREARKALHTIYKTPQERALAVLHALKIIPTIRKMNTVIPDEEMILIDLVCDFDALFAGYENEVYQDVADYFKQML